jgi:hypothetical protein
LNIARERRENFQSVLTRYALERLLYRIGRSEFRAQFVLKGALLFALWAEHPQRATRDLDLLSQGDPSTFLLDEAFRNLCSLGVEDDGLLFLAESVASREIREDNIYGGLRIMLTAMLGVARIPLQVDIGFGDAITPGPMEIDFPTLLPFPAPHLFAYPRETVVAEKFEALVTLGMANSRMKDFFDLWTLALDYGFEGEPLSAAIAATFKRRTTPLPLEMPTALTGVFAEDDSKQRQWLAFIKRSVPGSADITLPEAIYQIRLFLLPMLEALANGHSFRGEWPTGGPWQMVI